MSFNRNMMVKQHVGVVHGRFGSWRVFETGDEKFYLFSTIAPDGQEGGLQFPVRKTRLRDEIRRALRNGCGYDARKESA